MAHHLSDFTWGEIQSMWGENEMNIGKLKNLMKSLKFHLSVFLKFFQLFQCLFQSDLAWVESDFQLYYIIFCIYHWEKFPKCSIKTNHTTMFCNCRNSSSESSIQPLYGSTSVLGLRFRWQYPWVSKSEYFGAFLVLRLCNDLVIMGNNTLTFEA